VTFATAAEVEVVQGRFLEQLLRDPEAMEAVRGADVSFLLKYHDPDCSIRVDCNVSPAEVTFSTAEQSADVELSMSAHNGHLMWLGELNMLGAMAMRKIKVKGNVGRMIGMMPLMTMATPRYKSFYEQHA
jgi:putative sterol carrier protein